MEGIVFAASELVVKVGDEQVLAFVTENRSAHIGTVGVISPILRSFISRFPDRHSIVLQVAELIGDQQEKKRARVVMREEVAKTAGARSARAYYEGSALRSAVWTNLLAAAPSAEVARRILSVRARLGASVDANGDLKLDLEVLGASDRALIDEEKLKKAILTEFSIIAEQDDSYRPAMANANDIQTGRVRELLMRVRHAPRQEERIAILINGILENQSVGTSALLQYGKDRAKFANSALEKIREHLNTSDSNENRELSAAKLVAGLYGMQYPANRGNFLLYFAKYLAKWPLINRELRYRLERTRSIFVEYLRPTINDYLSGTSKVESPDFDLPLFVSLLGDKSRK
ncbi:hypothetical protein MesoLj113c_09100 [Mesorhizobium sp. 113-3-9]|nr:hypothetical protein MesoLj113c_09100 [Mesorhizobium sp. 113-3-9]